jgi:hypothetical protein
VVNGAKGVFEVDVEEIYVLVCEACVFKGSD